jgi:hypothetical protein
VAYHVVVESQVSRGIGAAGLTRAGVNRVLSNLHFDLKGRADEFRSDRFAEDLDLFRYPFTLIDGGRGHDFHFVVNDVRATGYLFVVDVRHQSHPLPPAP